MLPIFRPDNFLRPFDASKVLPIILNIHGGESMGVYVDSSKLLGEKQGENCPFFSHTFGECNGIFSTLGRKQVVGLIVLTGLQDISWL